MINRLKPRAQYGRPEIRAMGVSYIRHWLAQSLNGFVKNSGHTLGTAE